MEKQQMIKDLVRYELEFFLSNPNGMDIMVDWVVNNSISKLDDETIRDLWIEKIKEN